MKLSTFIIFLLLLCILVIAKHMVRFILMEKWPSAIPLLQLLCISGMWYPIHLVNLNILKLMGVQIGF